MSVNRTFHRNARRYFQTALGGPPSRDDKPLVERGIQLFAEIAELQDRHDDLRRELHALLGKLGIALGPDMDDDE